MLPEITFASCFVSKISLPTCEIVIKDLSTTGVVCISSNLSLHSFIIFPSESFSIEVIIYFILLAGIILIVMGLAKFGAIIKFIPYPVTVGFTAGIAVIIALGQVPNFFGLRFLAKDPADAIGKIKLYVSSMDTINVYSVIIGLIALAVCIFWPKITNKVPGSLIAIIVATVIVKVLGWDDPVNGHGVVTIGMKNHIPSGFPTPHLPNIRLDMMQKAGIPVVAREIVPMIINRKNDGQCPIENLLRETFEAEEGIKKISAFFNDEFSV